MFKRFMQLRLRDLVILAVILFSLPAFLDNPFHYELATQMAIIAATVVGLNLLVGYAGQVSLGHAGFFGLGAYFSAIMTGSYGWSALPALLVGAILVGVIAWIVGRPILRLKGHYLSMATLAVGFIIAIIINNETGLTGGPDGIPVAPFDLFGWELSPFGSYSLLGVELSGSQAWYLFSALVLLLAVWLAQNLIDSQIGRALRSVHGSEVAARVVGVNTAKYKSLVFVISAIYASVMGSLYAHFQGFITPAVAGFDFSIVLITMVVLGGMGSTMGVILGAVVLKLLPQLLADFQELEAVMFGLILMLTMIFMPKGLLPTLQRSIGRRLKKKAEGQA
ncbi:branched-chain amino acid ABC transporter permease [Marinobacter lutaoensis]|jgi:branched-chain amino acid transport system permease protein|uniref:Branched-chain amino acid ABC transporter permease n=1 Tax=Marinobacter lutaoensis TaxID=135739 RepID=A0A1V2DQP3_9GAMM|nr:branched-chain amino acid ABC transporter permease [Marinobacter lutaoensis]MBE01673.1 branched-chain amino acid ABC transporter permease [Marinobacter sp.]MBI43546.1 branched-chain amino acid ABC transporter permease [Oceanospirillales bacterium]NVD35275.1 branched-chain amino acid ABC transporter permease [Marinobacter lutaoensis]ONF42696.1 branched-chain amino acid ABC transporter permease [Marinobacter lutaoensis]|tara:strand:+ start:1991 stop:2998 length:1008 start_codon:yes stop_codon:yes gene_type:complete